MAEFWSAFIAKFRGGGRARSIGDHLATPGSSLEQALLDIFSDGEEADAREIAEECTLRSCRTIGHGQMYSPLDRLERRGAVTARLGADDAGRPGHRHKFYRLTR
ncbi:MAG TPA: hypothetical protein VGN72_10740 [Tepidisphaeraceae bacterium]|jgi:DNA-binding PadR family transcriptional regulator|nr:hypothetical protein [Tepidisphaeraceae bacterium]